MPTSLYEIGWANTILQPAPASGNIAERDMVRAVVSDTAIGTTGRNRHPQQQRLTFNDPSASPPWNINQFQGKYVYLTTAGASGQARRGPLSRTPRNALTVTPAFTLPQGALNYIITESHGYVLITSGRATNRLFPIAWDAVDPQTASARTAT